MALSEPTNGGGGTLPIEPPAKPEVLENEQRTSSQTVIRSNIFAATVHRAGVTKRFIELQNVLIQITAAESDIRAYGSGEIFDDLIKEFESPESGNPFDDHALFGVTDPPQHTTVISQTRKALRRVSNAMELIRLAIQKLTDIYAYVDKQVADTDAEYLSNQPRTEDLLEWAYRKGALLRPDITGARRLSIQTRATAVTTNPIGLLKLLDEILLELQTLLNIPAYYRTATSSDTSKIEIPVKTVYVRTGETLERLAFRILGDADKAVLIMEFNDLAPEDIMGDGWVGRKLNVPYKATVQGERLANNFVLDSQTGIKVLGRDLPNELVAEGGDLKVLQHTDTLFQSLNNIIQTPVGAIPEEPEYGCNILKLENASIPQVAGDMVAVEVRRALMTNPRVASVTGMTAIRDEDTYRIKYQVTPVNDLTEAELQSNLEIT